MAIRTVSLTLVIAFVATISGCIKEPYCEVGYIIDKHHSYDTIYPSIFLARYPGSWWEYSNGSRDSCHNWEAVPIWLASDDISCPIVSEDMVYLPSGHVYNNQYVWTPEGKLNTVFNPIVDTLIGVVYSTVDYGGSARITVSLVTVDRSDTMQVNGVIYSDVIHMKYSYEVYYWHIDGGPPATVTDSYYARNVGLIKQKRFDYFRNIDDQIELVNHYIAPH
ncbi:MAG: hypothetical protein K9J17_11705 [Flavobacteriales bacterium]|nr:hypothetical protein [Flavobacteriales bacterium]